MVKVQVNGHEYYLDGLLKKNLDAVKAMIRKDWDYVFVVDGEVGSGKSVLTQQMAYYVSDGKFTVEQICFDPKDFKEQVLKAPRYGAIVFDEAFRGMSARSAMTATNRVLMSMLQEIRQKNLFIFIVLPSVWDLDKYVALHRCKGCFHVEVDANRTRGFFKFFNKNQLMNLLKDYKLKYKYPYSPKFKGRFVKYQPIDKDAYLKKKTGSLGDYAYEDAEKTNRDDELKEYWKENTIKLKSALKKYGKVSLKKVCQEFGLNYDTIRGLELRLPTIKDTNLENAQILPKNKGEDNKELFV